MEYGLQASGQCFQGFVEDYEALLARHQMETITSYGVRRSRHETPEREPNQVNYTNRSLVHHLAESPWYCCMLDTFRQSKKFNAGYVCEKR